MEHDERSLVAPWCRSFARDAPGITGCRGFAADKLAAEPADPATAVLERCEPLDVTVRGVDARQLLNAAYEALARREDD